MNKKLIENGTEVLIFEYIKGMGPNQNEEHFIKGTIKACRTTNNLSYYDGYWYEAIYEVLGNDGNTYIGPYGNIGIGDSFFRTKEDHIKALQRKISKNEEETIKLQEQNIEYKKQIELILSNLQEKDENLTRKRTN